MSSSPGVVNFSESPRKPSICVRGALSLKRPGEWRSLADAAMIEGEGGCHELHIDVFAMDPF